MTEILQSLFIAWQSPRSHHFYPVGRLAQIRDETTEEWFEFVYVRAAEEAQRDGFLPFLSFPDVQGLYRSRELFPLFSNRLLSVKRPDYGEYLEQLGLSNALAMSSPLLILGRSGGRRATDTLELFPMPVFEPEFGYRTWFWSHGIRNLEIASQKCVNELVPETPLLLVPEPNISDDPQAIALHTEEGTHVGYMPAYLLDDALTLQERCEYCEVFVELLNPPPAPNQQRLFCRLESCWPTGFTPYSTARYQALNRDATPVAVAVEEVVV